MKQGSGKEVKTGRKAEPNPKAIGVGAVSRMGSATVFTKTPPSMNQGRGYKAPMAAETRHPSGSQKKR